MRGLAGMAPKAIQGNGSIVVTTLAKIGVARVDAIGCLASVTGDTFFQTVFASSYATAQGVAALVFQQHHMISPHIGRISHALATSGGFNHRHRDTPHIGLCSRYTRTGCQAAC